MGERRGLPHRPRRSRVEKFSNHPPPCRGTKKRTSGTLRFVSVSRFVLIFAPFVLEALHVSFCGLYQARRLTSNSASEIPEAFSPDGKYVLFSASIQDPVESALFPSSRMTELYKVPVKGGSTVQVLGTPAKMMSYLPDGKRFLYQDVKGFEDEWRKHHTSSVTRDIWLYDPVKSMHVNLTDRGGEDRNPVMAADGNTFYFLSERNGRTMNVYSATIENPKDAKAVTDFKIHPVRFLSRDVNGILCFTYDGEIYTMPEGGD